MCMIERITLPKLCTQEICDLHSDHHQLISSPVKSAIVGPYGKKIPTGLGSGEVYKA